MKPPIKQIRRTEKQIRSLLHLGQKYHGTVTKFCQVHKIHKATFYSWRNKYGVTPQKEPTFVPLQISNQLQEASLFAEIELAPNVTIRLFHKVDACWFKTLL